MHLNKPMTEIVGRKKYSTETATLIADDEYWDGGGDKENDIEKFKHIKELINDSYVAYYFCSY